MSEIPTRVLAVDDHPMVTQGMRSLIAGMPDMSLVATAASVAGALDACVAHGPDLIVMDINLPDGDAIQATRRLRQLAPTARVLVLSMHSDEEFVFGALRAGAHGYVLKGAPHDHFARALRAVAAGEAVFGAGIADRVLQHFGAAPPPVPDPLQPLSDREREVLDLLAGGLGTKEIGRRLFLSPKTIRNHISNIVGKLQLADRAHAISYARQAGLGERPGARGSLSQA
jgi:DNA-binding NarL/FixJ family response regulator